MKKILSLVLALALCLTPGVTALAAGTHTVTIINGMDGSVAETFTVADGEDLVFSISCSAPCDMGPIASGELGAGVTTDVGKITYSNVTTGGPNAYPTAETVTITGITKDAKVTVTPNPDEVGSVFPVITEGELAGGSGEPSGDASSDEPYPKFDEYKEYLYATMIQDTFWQGNADNLRAGLDAATSPNDESIQNFTGSGAVDQAPAGVVFPMTYDVWYAENYGAAGTLTPGEYTNGTDTLVINDDLSFVCTTVGQNLEGADFTLIITGTLSADGKATLTGLTDGMVELIEMATDDQKAGNIATVESLAAMAMTAGGSGEPSGEAGGTDMDAYVEYIHQWLLNEMTVNTGGMTIDIIENEFMPLVRAGDFTTFPAEMLFSGMLDSGVPMTYDEFVAAGGVY